MKQSHSRKSGVSVKRKFPIDGLKWIPYSIGWIFGVFFQPFWIVLFIVGLLSQDKHYFIDVQIHNFVYVWGIICIGLILLAIIFASFLMTLIATTLLL